VSFAATVLEEVTVTAQKREQNLQDVGISVSAFSGEQLDALGLTTSTDITQQVPGLQVYQFNPGLTILNLRGISQNNFTDTLEAPVAVYVDGAYTASLNAVSAQLFDMKRVEVLRGPQGTLFGRNATGGLVHYITNKADEDELNGYMEVGYGTFNKKMYEGAVGGGLSDTVRGRFAGRVEKQDGYVESLTDGVRDAHGADAMALRGTLQVDFSDNFTGDFTLAYSKDDDVPSGAYTFGGASVDPNTGFGMDFVPADDVHTHTSDTQGYLEREIIDFTASLAWDLNNGMELVSITNYKDIDKDYLEDADAGTFTPAFEFTAQFEAQTEQFSQELRLSGEGDRSRWTVGGYYLDFEIDSNSIVDDPPFPGFVATGGDLQGTAVNTVLDSKNWSVFGQGEYDINEKWTAIAGARFSQDDKEIDWNVNGVLPDGTFVTDLGGANMSSLLAAGTPGLSDSIDYGDIAAKLQLNYYPSDDLLVFASLNRGIKGGNWTPPILADPTVVLQHGEEVLLSYELGAKYTLPEGKGRLNATAFYYDYSDYQAFSFNAFLTPQVTNSDAKAYGAELELFLTPAAGWDFVLGAAAMSSEVDAVPDLFGGNVSGVELPNAPSLSLNWLARYTIQQSIMDGFVSLQVDGNYNAEQFLLGTNADATKEDAYSVWNASVNYVSLDQHWKGSLWVKNLTDEDYRIYSLDLAAAIGGTTDVYAPPLTAGVSLAYHF